MADDPKGEMPAEPVETPIEPKAEAKVDAPAKADDSPTLAELEKTREALKKANKEAAERRKRLEELEAAEAERQKAAMTETERIQARIKELEQENAEKDRLLKEKERQDLQRKVAKAVGIPDGLATRLTGEDEDAMTEDAKAILELLPKQQEAEKKPAPPRLDPTNPGNGQKTETAAQKKGRILGTRGNVWDGSGATERGGGVVIVEKD